MAQGGRARSRAARHRQRVGSDGVPGLGVRPPPPPPHPATARVSDNPAASSAIVDCHGLTPGWVLFSMTHAIAARIRASINRLVRPGGRGGTSGRGRDRGALIEAAVVVTVTVTFVAELPAVSGFGETVQVASEGAPVQVKVTVPDNPPSPPTLNV